MGGMASVLVSQLIVPTVSTGIVSSMKQKAVSREANAVADIIEERIRDYFSEIVEMFSPKEVVYVADTDEELEALIAEDRAKVNLGQGAIKIATSLVSFLVRYPEAVAGEILYKDLVCDLFSAVTDLIPIMRQMELPKDTVAYAELLVQEVTKLVEEDNAKEAADMIFEGIKQLTTNNAFMEVINGVVQ